MILSPKFNGISTVECVGGVCVVRACGVRVRVVSVCGETFRFHKTKLTHCLFVAVSWIVF